MSADEVYQRLKDLEESGALNKYDEAQKLGRKRSSVGGKRGSVTGADGQNVEVVGCQCVIC